MGEFGWPSGIRDFLQQQVSRITHIAVAHTQFKPFGRDAYGMDQIVAAAKKECLHFRNCLSRELYGRMARRKPSLYQPLIISTLEGSLIRSDRNLTLHYTRSSSFMVMYVWRSEYSVERAKSTDAAEADEPEVDIPAEIERREDRLKAITDGSRAYREASA